MLAGAILETVDFLGRRGVTVRFTMVEGTAAALGFPMTNAPYRNDTVRINILRRVVIFRLAITTKFLGKAPAIRATDVME